jgi:MFS family permease
MRSWAGAARQVPTHARLMLGSMFLSSVPIGLLMVFFPLYLHDLGLRSFVIGGIFTIAGIASSLLLLAIGPLADRFGRRSFLIAGTALPVLGFIIFVLTTDSRWLVVASMLGGVGFSGGLGGGLVTATFNPVLAGIVPPRLRTAMLSWAEGAWAFAMGAGALLAGLPALLARTHVVPLLVADRSLFVVCLLVTVGATVLLLPVHEGEEAIASSVSPAPAGACWDARASLPTMLKLAVFFALQGAGLGLVVQLLPLWFALRFHTTAAAIAPWFAAAQLVGLLTIPLVPALARRLGTARMIVLVAALSTLMLAGVPFASVLPLAGLFYVLRSGFVSMQWPAQQSFLQGAVDPRVRGTATSLALGCWSITNALLPTLGGYLMDRRLLAWPLVLGLACYSMAAIWFWLTLRHTLLPEEMAAHEAPVTGPGTVEPVEPSAAR